MRSPNGANVTGRDRARRPTSPRGRFGPAGTHQSVRNDAGPDDRQPSRTGDGTWDRSGAAGSHPGQGPQRRTDLVAPRAPIRLRSGGQLGATVHFRPGSAADCDRAGWTAPGRGSAGDGGRLDVRHPRPRRDRIVAAASSSRIMSATSAAPKASTADTAKTSW